MSLTPGTGTDPRERAYLSPYTTSGFGLTIIQEGALANPDGPVTATLTNDDDGTVVMNAVQANNVSTGVYQVPTTAQQTSSFGDYTVTWNYVLNGVAQTYQSFLLIGTPSPSYDSLSLDMKSIVETTWIRFADLYDSPSGGPNLQTYFQAHFGRGRVAELLRIAIGTLNTAAQPYQTYTIDAIGGAAFPVDKWGALLERALYVEVLKHLVRSYVEQPLMQTGEGITRQDRRDYMDRWNQILGSEEDTLKQQLDVFKIQAMGLGQATVLAAGGVFGRYFNTRTAAYAAARPGMAYRWY